jgi:hypothetical protein
MERVKDEVNADLNILADEFEPHLKFQRDYLDLGLFTEHLQEAAERGTRSLRAYYEDGAPFEKVSSFLNKLKDLPSDYFEAKFPRAVQLEEFEAAIIPEDLDPKLKKVLEDRGLELREYSKKSGEFYRDDETPRREALQKQTEEAGLRFMPQPTFYSKAERAVEGAKAGIFNKEGMTSVGQAKALLEKNAPETELEWSGVLDYLDLQKEESNKVSKQDLLSYLKNNGVEVEEVLRSGSDTDTLREKYADQMLQRYEIDTDPDAIDENGEMLRGFGGDVVRLEGSIIDAEAGLRDMLFDEALKMPDNELREIVENRDLSGTVGPTLFSPTEQFAGGPAALPGGENYSELVLKLPEGSLKGGESEYFDAPSGHRFPEDNILAHIRFTERTDADGKRMLYLDEVQSDWNTDIREKGVRKERPAKVKRQIASLEGHKRRKMTKEIERLDKELKEKYEGGMIDSDKMYTERRQLINKVDTSEIDSRIAELEQKHPINPTGAPDMPYKGSKWQDLVMKRMIRWAADNGYDRLGWITGKDTAQRYNLKERVSSIRYFKRDGEDAELTVLDKEGRSVLDKTITSEDQIEQYIGKEMASRLLSKDPEVSDNVGGEGKQRTQWLEGEDLQIGGVWAENLYDKSLPKIARKLTKKKGAVGRVGIFGSSSKLNGALAKNGIKPKYEANYVDISPEVKELAQEGFSYFMPEGRGGAASAPVQTAAPQPPSGVIIPKVKLTEDEKEESRKLLQQLLD